MSRRSELADVADGMSGRWIRWAPWEPVPIIALLVEMAVRSESRAYSLVFYGGRTPIAGTMQRRLRQDLLRHLERRRLSAEWVATAEVEVWVETMKDAYESIPVRGRFTIVDDRGRIHTSTRNILAERRRAGFVGRLLEFFHARR